MLSTPRPTLDQLRDRFGEAIVTATDAGWDAARASFNLVVDQRPPAVALPGSAVEAARIVAAIRDAGLRIAPQGSAHNPIPLGSLEDTVIVKLDRLTGVEIDAERGVARVEAGARWWDVVPKAAEHGLSVLHGSSPEINVVGYSLGGGVGWQARKRGLQTNSITAIEIVTADGEHRVVDADNEPELFWALRGGGGNFGLVTAIEFRLYPLREVYAGSLFFPYERSGEVFHAWREWTANLPEEVTSAVRMLQFPDLEIIPEIVRGGSFAVVGAAVLGDSEQGAELLRPLRELGAQTDTFAMIPAAELTELHMDPVEPMPYLARALAARRAAGEGGRRADRGQRPGQRLDPRRGRAPTPRRGARPRGAGIGSALEDEREVPDPRPRRRDEPRDGADHRGRARSVRERARTV